MCVRTALHELLKINWSYEITDKEGYCNYFEAVLVGIVDKIVTETEFVNNVVKVDTPSHVKKTKSTKEIDYCNYSKPLHQLNIKQEYQI